MDKASFNYQTYRIWNLTVTIFSIHDTQKLSMLKDGLSCPSGGIGRRSGLKIRWPQGRGGSSPPWHLLY